MSGYSVHWMFRVVTNQQNLLSDQFPMLSICEHACFGMKMILGSDGVTSIRRFI